MRKDPSEVELPECPDAEEAHGQLGRKGTVRIAEIQVDPIAERPSLANSEETPSFDDDVNRSRSSTPVRKKSGRLLAVKTFVLGDIRVRNFSIIFGDNQIEIEPAGVERVGNSICTTRFKWYTWLALSFWFQLRRIANVYFVIVAVLAALYVEGALVKTFVVFSVMMAQACKDLYEDHKRSRDDKAENTRKCSVFRREQWSFVSCEWQDVELGSLVKVEQGQQIPADLLIVASSDASGIFFLSTTSLDGETNLKQRVVPSLLQERLADSRQDEVLTKLEGLGLRVNLEVPQANLLSLDCQIELTSALQTAGCGLDNFALRGCELQNTHWVIGIACYTGHASKIRMNASKGSSKFTDLEGYLNYCVVRLLLAIGVISTVYAFSGKMPQYMLRCQRSDLRKWMKQLCQDNPDSMVDLFIKYAVMLWVALPVTLYILFEVLHIIFGKQIDMDTKMQDMDTGEFARARNTSIIEDLGQVSFVFSDKTGTLTANEMRFAFCFVGDTKFGPFLPMPSASCELELKEQSIGNKKVRTVLQSRPSDEKETSLKDAVTNFFSAIAVCHSVQMNVDQKYQAESPDELALVNAAASVGFSWAGRERNTSGTGELSRVQKQQSGGRSTGPAVIEEYRVVCELPFSSDRKRMSVVIPLDDGSGALVWTKGADSVMEKLLEGAFPENARESLEEYARYGYRTLVYGQRKMNTSTYADWLSEWQEAAASMEDRAEKLDDVYRIAENGLSFIGITAVEDRLQDGVPSTIESLRAAEVRVWVLTGDKVETAVEIARSCKLFDDSMTLAYVVGVSSSNDAIHEFRRIQELPDSGQLGIVLDGQSVGCILESPMASKALYDVALRSSSCVCCRLSPLQKRRLIELVRKQDSKAITLAIGDGANDVPMIQGAHVGVGIRGKEGAASVQASDFAISQFRFLGILMFVHGRKAYRRLATFICYFFYKSIVICCPYVIHAFAAKFRGEVPISPFLDSMYAPLTSWSAALVVAFDEDVPDEEVLAAPGKFYSFGPSREGLNFQVFLRWMVTACVHGWISWVLVMDWNTTRRQRGRIGIAWWQASFAAYSTILLTVHLKLVVVGRFRLGRVGACVLVAELLVYFVGALIAGEVVSAGGLPAETFCFADCDFHDPHSPGAIVRGFFTDPFQIACCVLLSLTLMFYDLAVSRLRLFLRFWCCIAVELLPVFILWAHILWFGMYKTVRPSGRSTT